MTHLLNILSQARYKRQQSILSHFFANGAKRFGFQRAEALSKYSILAHCISALNTAQTKDRLETFLFLLAVLW